MKPLRPPCGNCRARLSVNSVKLGDGVGGRRVCWPLIQCSHLWFANLERNMGAALLICVAEFQWRVLLFVLFGQNLGRLFCSKFCSGGACRACCFVRSFVVEQFVLFASEIF